MTEKELLVDCLRRLNRTETSYMLAACVPQKEMRTMTASEFSTSYLRGR